MPKQNHGAQPVPEPTTPSDWMAIAHLNVWAHREFAFDLGAEAWPPVVQALTAVRPAAEHSQFIVVRDGQDLLGSVAYRGPGSSNAPLRPEWASIELLSVSPAARRQGVATALVDACLAKAVDDGAPGLACVVHNYMTAAQALLAALGFRREQGLGKRDESPYWIYLSDLPRGGQQKNPA